MNWLVLGDKRQDAKKTIAGTAPFLSYTIRQISKTCANLQHREIAGLSQIEYSAK